VNSDAYGGKKLPAAQVYIPRIYGFKVSERAKSGPRMQWLRTRPQDQNELDLVDWKGRWIGSDAYEEDEEDAVEGEMEDFDPDHGDDDDEESEEEEEEEEGTAAPVSASIHAHATSGKTTRVR